MGLHFVGEKRKMIDAMKEEAKKEIQSFIDSEKKKLQLEGEGALTIATLLCPRSSALVLR
jgi:hypothetical protein